MYKHKISFAVIILAICVSAIALFNLRQRYPVGSLNTTIPTQQKKSEEEPKKQASTSENTLYKIPNTLYLSVPFTPQAPTANWDTLHNEACEEASAIMAYSYFSAVPSSPASPPKLQRRGSEEKMPAGQMRLKNGDSNLDVNFVESEIQKLTTWQDENFGYHLDTTSAETAQMIREVYGLNTKLVENFTAKDIKKELAQNRLVIISEYGRALGNPYYKSPGPIHHMLLIKGFDDIGNFITNDSGTKRGLNYPYTFDVLYNAAADWSHETNNVDLNKKIMIVVWE